MKTQTLDSAGKRVPIAVAALTALLLMGAGIYLFMRAPNSRPADGQKIIAAARAYTHALQESHAPIQATVPLQTLIDKGLLQPADVGAFQGMEAKVFLIGDGNGPSVVMQVHMGDGTDFVLLNDGSVHQVKR